MTAAKDGGSRALRALMRRVLALLFFVLAAVPGAGRGQGPALRHQRAGLWPPGPQLPRPARPAGIPHPLRQRRARGRVRRADQRRAARRRRHGARLCDHRPRRSRPEGHPLRAPDDAQRQSPRSRRKALHRPDAGDLAGPAARVCRPTVVAALSQRAEDAAQLAEQQRKAEEALRLKPVATVRVGRNPTFVRVQFTWSVDTEGAFAVDGTTANLDFDWPVPIDLYAIKADLPPELLAVENSVSPDGSRVAFTTAEGVVPRFYAISPTEFVVDIDIVPAGAGRHRSSFTRLAEPDPHAAAAEPVTTMPAEPEHTADDGRAVRHRRRQHGAAGLPVRARHGRRRVPPRRQRLDAVRHADQHRRAAEPCDADAGRRRLLGARRGRHAGGPSRPDHRAARDARHRGPLVGAVARRHHPLAHRADPAQPPPRRRGAVRDDRRSRPSRHHPPVPRSDGRRRADGGHRVPPARGVVRSLDFVDFTALASVHGLVIRAKSDDARGRSRRRARRDPRR